MKLPETARDVKPRTTWTVLTLLDWAAGYLRERGFDEPRLDAELLLAEVLKMGRLDLYLQFDRPLLPEELSAFKSLFRRRLSHEPMQYILGKTGFMGLPFIVTNQVLIPRPETEVLVEKALEEIRRLGPRSVAVADIGTGSGNIAISIAHYVPAAIVTAIDVSPEALKIAAANAEKNLVPNVRFRQADLFDDPFGTDTFDVILSNPPYIPVEEFVKLPEEIRVYEPRIATTDEGDGYRFIRQVLSLAARHLQPGAILLMEIGFGQAQTSVGVAEAAGFVEVTLTPDFAGIPRVLAARRRRKA
jgi:release factor glutamine methyltransferase